MDLSNGIVIHKKINDIEFLEFKKLLEFQNIKHAYTLKNLDFKRRDTSKLPEYEKLFKTLNIDINTLVKPNQTHTDRIIRILSKSNEPEIYKEYLNDYDASITNLDNVTLASTNADCLLILFYDPEKNVIANVHSGWRGTAQMISKKTVQMMKKEYGSNPENILCFFCPSIRSCHFEVDIDVKEIFEDTFKYTNRLDEIIKKGQIKDGKQKYNIDTILINKILLEEENIKKENIYDSGICSVCSSKYIHSRRAEGENFGVGTAIIEKY